MKDRITKVDYVFSIIILFVSCLGLAIFIEHLLGYQYQEWFYENGIYDPYTNVNVVNRWADFCFFTYISLIIFCLWGIVRFISIVFRLERLYKLVNNSYLILFICLNQFIVCLLYTIFQVAFKGTFGWWDNSPRSLHSLGTNITVHYFITAIGIVYFLIHNFEKVKFKKCLLFLIFFTIYGIIVKITGMHCYVFEWYPYPIFSKDALWHALFGNFNAYNDILAMILLILAIVLIIGIYLIFLWVATKHINRKSAIKEKKNNHVYDSFV